MKEGAVMPDITPFTPSIVMEEASRIAAGGEIKKKAIELILDERIPIINISINFHYETGESLQVSVL